MDAQADEFLLIDTPENVVFGYEVAGIGSRFLAALVDSLLIGGLVLVVFLTAGMVLSVLDIFTGLTDTSERAAGVILALSGLLTFAFIWGYYVFFELLWNGQSPGKRWVGLRVLGTQGQPIGISEAVIRNLIRLIDLLPGTYAVGIITMFVNDQSRRLGDFAAGTLVVYDRGMVSLDMLGRSSQQRPLLRPNDQILESMAGLPVDQLEEEDIILVESFLDRHHDLPNRSVLADQLIDYLFRRMSVPTRPVAAEETVSYLQGVIYLRRTAAKRLAVEQGVQRTGQEMHSGDNPLEQVAGGEQSPEDWTRKGLRE